MFWRVANTPFPLIARRHKKMIVANRLLIGYGGLGMTAKQLAKCSFAKTILYIFAKSRPPMPDLRIHEYETRQELFHNLPAGVPLVFYFGHSPSGAVKWHNEYSDYRKIIKAKIVWRWKDLAFVGEEDGE